MNLLAFDWDGSVAPLVRAALAGGRHRVSCESDPDRARLKLDTALFDALLIGPAGMPQALAEYVDAEWPGMPILVAGVERELPPSGRVAAVLARPISVERLAIAVQRVERRLQAQAGSTYDMPVDLIAGEQRLACRLIRNNGRSILLEWPGGEAGHEPAEAPAVEGPLAIMRGERRFEGDVAFRERRWLAVRVGSGVSELLEVEDASSDHGPPDRRGLSRLPA